MNKKHRNRPQKGAGRGVGSGHLKREGQRSSTSATPWIALIAALPFADTA